jgi:predicted RNase H-like HicB family nuclease
MKTRFLVIVHKSKYGYDTSCPALPGCASQGTTLREALSNIRSAINEYLGAVSLVKKNARLVEVDIRVPA